MLILAASALMAAGSPSSVMRARPLRVTSAAARSTLGSFALRQHDVLRLLLASAVDVVHEQLGRHADGLELRFQGRVERAEVHELADQRLRCEQEAAELRAS